MNILEETTIGDLVREADRFRNSIPAAQQERHYVWGPDAVEFWLKVDGKYRHVYIERLR